MPIARSMLAVSAAALLAAAVAATVAAAVATPPIGSITGEKPPELSRARVPAILLNPLPAKGGVPYMVPPSHEKVPPEKTTAFEAQFRALKSKHFGQQAGPLRKAGIEHIQSFADAASFGPMWVALRTEKDDVRLAVLDHYAKQGLTGQSALAWVAIREKAPEIRAEATRRIQKPPVSSVLAVLDEALRSTEHETVNNAGLLAGNIHAIEALPALIFAQATQDTVKSDGDLAWIAIGTTKSYVANVIPVTGDNSGAFQPVIGTIIEGVVMRIAGCVATTYRADVHDSLISMSSYDTGTDTARLNWNMHAWWRWFNEEYVPFKQRQDQELAKAAESTAAATGAANSTGSGR